jgi:hypothetical protein
MLSFERATTHHISTCATEAVQLAGSLPPQQPPKSFAQNLDILMSGSVTAGAATRRRGRRLTDDA